MKIIYNKKSIFIISVLCLILFLLILSIDYGRPTQYKYGVSFSRLHADGLGLDWKETYLAILNELKVKNLRLSAHWNYVEKEEGEYDFEALDFQISEAEKRNTSVILAIGRRLPGWPECHEPEWAKNLDKGKKQEEILSLIKTLVERYKTSKSIKIWQVENEPFLIYFSRSTCGELDTKFLDEEIALVRKLDPTRPILMTDSGELGLWFPAYIRGEMFGTSLYLYIWHRALGPFRYPITPAFFRIKHNFVKLFVKDKPAVVIELSSEPWLLQPITDVPIVVQLDRMGIDKFNETIEFSQKTGFGTFYFWGAEWWYWMKKNKHPEFWERAKEIFNSTPIVKVGQSFLNIKVANSEEEREKGLSGTEKLEKDEGMIFVFEKPDNYGFWMKDMKFALDIIWVDNHHTVVEISKNITPETFPEVFKPTSPVIYVVEVNSGWVDENNIKIGDKINF